MPAPAPAQLREPAPAHQGEPHDRRKAAARSNWLRAGVLDTNDGIISTAGLVIGVAGTTSAHGPILTAGVAGPVAGAVSTALGEHVSVSSSHDSERSLLERARGDIAESPYEECAQLAGAGLGIAPTALSPWSAARAVVRMVVGGAVGMAFAYGIGLLLEATAL